MKHRCFAFWLFLFAGLLAPLHAWAQSSTVAYYYGTASTGQAYNGGTATASSQGFLYIRSLNGSTDGATCDLYPVNGRIHFRFSSLSLTGQFYTSTSPAVSYTALEKHSYTASDSYHLFLSGPRANALLKGNSPTLVATSLQGQLDFMSFGSEYRYLLVTNYSLVLLPAPSKAVNDANADAFPAAISAARAYFKGLGFVEDTGP